MTYRAPVRDLVFALQEVAGFGALAEAFPGADPDTVTAVLEGGGDFASEVLAPLNRPGDLAGATYENGRVTAAPGFAEAYRRFVEGGWNGIAADPAHGGQGLPRSLDVALSEIVQAANLSFGLCPLLTQGAIEAIARKGDARQAALYLPKLVSGEWTGAMNLTEAQAGSDLAALATRAEPDGDGYRLTGQKIFITWGDHDLAENIVHLVLARLPGAPEGSRGLSLFLAPKRLVNEDGSLGAPNNLRPASIEHKLGINASPTCVMLYEGARAELLGPAGGGLAGMFVMMNAARLGVGVQGVAVAERAYQAALAYALERQQGRSVWTGGYPARIFDHPDVRRTLMLAKAKIEAARGICFSTAVAGDLARVAADEAARASAKLREDLLTPIAKAWSTDMALEATSAAVQIHGGMGFVEETGVAQYYRDARILPIYEGTNGIHAIDLAGRKLGLGDGQALRELLGDIDPTVATLNASPEAALRKMGERLGAGAQAVRLATDWMLERRESAEPDMLSGATAYLKLVGDVTGGWMLGKGALAAAAHLAAGDEGADHWRAKIALAQLFGEQVLALAPGVAEGVMQGAAPLTAVTAEALGA